MTKALSLFFIVEPPSYQYMACYLAASIRKHLSPDVQVIGYCPAHKIDQLNPAAVEALRRMRVEVRPFDNQGKFSPDYPHGNKILSALEPRDSEFSAFMDSDILLINDNDFSGLYEDGHLSASVAASMRWAPKGVWEKIYGAFGMDLPEERVELMRIKRKKFLPYFSSGFVFFPENKPLTDGKRFAQIWMETAQHIDAIPDLENKRPYLDQMSLPVAMYRAGLKWKELPENEHYIMGGMLRGQPLPADMDVKTVHYRQWPVLVDSNMEHIGYDALKSQINTTRVKWVHDQPLPPGIDPLPVAGQSHTIPSDGSAPHIIQQTPKGAEGKSGCAAMTMVHQDHVFLERWVDYYSKQLGRENLYVLRHGDDPEVDRIAAGATIINVPRLDNLDTFDEQRWAMLSSFATGLTIYYNWVLCTDVDEIVAVDPDVCWNLAAYLDDKLNEDPAPNLIAPFPIEVVHTPATEQSAIIPGANILEVRRNFRVAPRRAKHCIVGRKITFSGDGVGSNVNSNVLDPNLFLFHLGSFDTDICKQRNAERQNKDARPDTSNGLEPLETRSNFPELVTQMQQGYRQDSAGNWRFGDVTAPDLYRLPDRFRTLF